MFFHFLNELRFIPLTDDITDRSMDSFTQTMTRSVQHANISLPAHHENAKMLIVRMSKHIHDSQNKSRLFFRVQIRSLKEKKKPKHFHIQFSFIFSLSYYTFNGRAVIDGLPSSRLSSSQSPRCFYDMRIVPVSSDIWLQVCFLLGGGQRKAC